MTNQNDDRIAQTFRQLLVKCNTNAYRIAKKTGIDKAYLSKLSSGAIAKPGKEKLGKIAQALDMQQSQLLRVFTNPQVAIQELNLTEIDLDLIQPVASNQQKDWGNAPDGIVCYDRDSEIEQVKHWIDSERSRIVTIYGLGGIGKSTLAMEVAKQLESEFDYILWRNLGGSSLIEVIVQDALRLFGNSKAKDLGISQQITRLIDHLRDRATVVSSSFADLLDSMMNHLPRKRPVNIAAINNALDNASTKVAENTASLSKEPRVIFKLIKLMSPLAILLVTIFVPVSIILNPVLKTHLY